MAAQGAVAKEVAGMEVAALAVEARVAGAAVKVEMEEEAPAGAGVVVRVAVAVAALAHHTESGAAMMVWMGEVSAVWMAEVGMVGVMGAEATVVEATVAVGVVAAVLMVKLVGLVENPEPLPASGVVMTATEWAAVAAL